MTIHYRVCGLGMCEPSTVILGVRYGVCPLQQSCDPTRLCGYLAARRAVALEPEISAAFSALPPADQTPIENKGGGQ